MILDFLSRQNVFVFVNRYVAVLCGCVESPYPDVSIIQQRFHVIMLKQDEVSVG